MSDIFPTIELVPNGLPKLALAAPDGARAEVHLHGAHVTSWLPASGDERLFLSQAAMFEPGAAIRGGIPVIFPQFSGMGSLPKHGFVRTLPWTAGEADENGGAATARLFLSDDVTTRALWPHRFKAMLAVSVAGASLEVALSITNVDDAPYTFTVALHTYLRIADVARTTIQGLHDLRYVDAAAGYVEAQQTEALVHFPGEVDRIYYDVPGAVRLCEPDRELVVQAVGFPDVVVWNPGPDMGAALPDLEPDGYRRFVCIEAAAIGQPVHLRPGQRWQGAQILTAVQPAG